MSDTAVRLLRDGALEGESAPILVVSDTIACNSGPRVFHQLVQSLARAITSNHAQAKRLVILAIQNPPEVYHRSFEETPGGSSALKPSSEWLRVIDCFSDPWGWGSNDDLPRGSCTANEPVPPGHSSDGGALRAANARSPAGNCAEPFRSLGDLDLLTSAVVHAATDGQKGSLPTPRCCVVVDAVSVLLRHHSLPALMSWLEALTWQGVISSVLLLVHSDLHPPAALASLHYLAHATFTLEPPPPPLLQINHGLTSSRPQKGGCGGGEEVAVGAVRLRQKRRNGKVREVVEVFYRLPNGGVRFAAPPISTTIVVAPPVATTKGGGVKAREVSFKVEVSARERVERAKVVLPYEHQGEEGRIVRIYDGRQAVREAQRGIGGVQDKNNRGSKADILALSEGMDSEVIVAKLQTLFSDNREEDEEESSGEGHIHYLRNSDDDVPDSDEDLDDDLDI